MDDDAPDNPIRGRLLGCSLVHNWVRSGMATRYSAQLRSWEEVAGYAPACASQSDPAVPLSDILQGGDHDRRCPWCANPEPAQKRPLSARKRKQAELARLDEWNREMQGCHA